MITEHDRTRLEQIDSDIEEERITPISGADLVWMRGLLQDALDANEALREALVAIVQWSEAYPLDIFREPDFKKAAELLNVGGITLDAISAHVARHVVEGVGKVARDALNRRPVELLLHAVEQPL